MGSFAPQEKKGITLIVAVLSFSSASVLVLIIAGTEQPNPIIIGINALPESPNFLNALSRINAIRAIYPESSKIEKNKKSTSIGGKKESTVPEPAEEKKSDNSLADIAAKAAKLSGQNTDTEHKETKGGKIDLAALAAKASALGKK